MNGGDSGREVFPLFSAFSPLFRDVPAWMKMITSPPPPFFLEIEVLKHGCQIAWASALPLWNPGVGWGSVGCVFQTF